MTRLCLLRLAVFVPLAFCLSCALTRVTNPLPECPMISLRCSGWVTASTGTLELHALKGEVSKPATLTVTMSAVKGCAFPFERHSEDCGGPNPLWWTISGGTKLDAPGSTEITITFKATENKETDFCFGLKSMGEGSAGRYLTCAEPACCRPKGESPEGESRLGCASSCACGNASQPCGDETARRVVVHLKGLVYDPTSLKLPAAVTAFGDSMPVRPRFDPRLAPVVFVGIELTRGGTGMLELIKLKEVELSGTTGDLLPEGYAVVRNKGELLDRSFTVPPTAPGHEASIFLIIRPYAVARPFAVPGERRGEVEWAHPPIRLTVKGNRVATGGPVEASTNIDVRLFGPASIPTPP